MELCPKCKKKPIYYDGSKCSCGNEFPDMRNDENSKS